MDVSDADDLVQQVVLVVVLVGDNAEQVVVVSVDVGDLGAVALNVGVVLADSGALVVEVLLDVLDLSWLVDVQVSGLALWDSWCLVASVVWLWERWEAQILLLRRVVGPSVLDVLDWLSDSDRLSLDGDRLSWSS